MAFAIYPVLKRTALDLDRRLRVMCHLQRVHFTHANTSQCVVLVF